MRCVIPPPCGVSCFSWSKTTEFQHMSILACIWYSQTSPTFGIIRVYRKISVGNTWIKLYIYIYIIHMYKIIMNEFVTYNTLRLHGKAIVQFRYCSMQNCSWDLAVPHSCCQETILALWQSFLRVVFVDACSHSQPWSRKPKWHLIDRLPLPYIYIIHSEQVKFE